MDRKQNYRLNLNRIASKLTGENLRQLKFLCYDVIPAGDNERVLTPQDLFTELEQREKIAPNRLDFLHKCLQDIGRDDLATDLKTERESECGIEAGNAAIKVSSSATSATASCSSRSAIEEAESHNKRGKVEFQDGKFENACQQYTLALECLPRDQKEYRSKYFTNRAACYVNMKMFHEAHSDCDSGTMGSRVTSELLSGF